MLFSGTPCQIAGLKSYLGKEYENLLTVDIICHGVPSPGVWQKYLSHIENKYKDSIDKTLYPEFRSKDNGWKRYVVKIRFNKGKALSQQHTDNLYMKAFLKNYTLRDSCYDCYFKTIERESDITLGDLWGIENIVPEMNDDKGTSAVIINSLNGAKFFDLILGKIQYEEINIYDVALYNTAINNSMSKPENRDKFMNEITTEDFEKVVRKYCYPGFVEQVTISCKRTVKRAIKKLFKSLLKQR